MHKLHATHGLDHKCRSCGHALIEHDDETLECPDIDNRKNYTYAPKGPDLPVELWLLLLRMENAAVKLATAQHDPMLYSSHVRYKEYKKEYKEARFALNSYLAERLSKLAGYESFNLRAIPTPFDRDRLL